MKLVNLWRSVPTGKIYEMPVDWFPKFGGWELIATEQREG